MKVNTRKLATMSMLAAISIVLVGIIHFPLFPAAPFLEYDPADIPIFIGTFLYGPLAGLALTVVVSTIQALTVSANSGFVGALMHIFATGSFALVAGNIYRLSKNRTGAAIAILLGVLTMTASMVAWNLVFTPIFLGWPLDRVKPMILPVIVPFNLIKSGANGIITFFLYKSVSHILKEKAS